MYTEKPSADVFWLITISNTVDLQVSDLLMLLTQIITRLADLRNFSGGGGGWGGEAELQPNRFLSSLSIRRFWGKGEKWKRKNLLSPSPVGRPDTQATF